MVCIGTGALFPGNRSTGAPKSVRAGGSVGSWLAQREAARAFIEFGFEQMQCHRIHAFCSPENAIVARHGKSGHVVWKAQCAVTWVKDNQPQGRVYAILRDEG